MKILSADNLGAVEWNSFVSKNYPPAGAFIQSYEWGDFQEKFGRKTKRYVLYENDKIIAAFSVTFHPFFRKMQYAYVSRGPVMEFGASDSRKADVIKFIRKWAIENMKNIVFVRLEPPFGFLPKSLRGIQFAVPPYYVQPKHNLLVSLEGPKEEISKTFHSSTRSNISRAEKRGVTVKVSNTITDEELETFFAMILDTEDRNGGAKAFPSKEYFRFLLETVSGADSQNMNTVEKLSIRFFFGYQNGEPASMHMVLYFSDTATYLFGASFRKFLNSKVSTYLHYTAICDAKDSGMHYYDIGAIDEKKWPSLTQFKRQFKGTELSYIGNIDIVLHQFWYRVYSSLRKVKSLLRRFN